MPPKLGQNKAKKWLNFETLPSTLTWVVPKCSKAYWVKLGWTSGHGSKKRQKGEKLGQNKA
jgi:hypothetical protein